MRMFVAVILYMDEMYIAASVYNDADQRVCVCFFRGGPQGECYA